MAKIQESGMGMELFEKLEARIDKLVEIDRGLRQRIKELETEIDRKDLAIKEYEESIRRLESEKSEMKSRLDDIISKLDNLLNSGGEPDGSGEGIDSWS